LTANVERKIVSPNILFLNPKNNKKEVPEYKKCEHN